MNSLGGRSSSARNTESIEEKLTGDILPKVETSEGKKEKVKGKHETAKEGVGGVGRDTRHTCGCTCNNCSVVFSCVSNHVRWGKVTHYKWILAIFYGFNHL